MCRILQKELARIWPDVHGHHILGYGYSVPFLEPFLQEASRTIAFMPAQQGVCHWPANDKNIVALVQETHWPLETNAVSRIVFVHALENSEQVDALLEEARRVLESEGRIVFIVPNRTGIWARRDVTPFGFGRPYSAGQLENILSRHGFICTNRKSALYLLPSHRPVVQRFAKTFETVGQSVGIDYFGGVWIVEAIKRTYAGLVAPAQQKSINTNAPEAASIPV